jgi:hypothetical protein
MSHTAAARPWNLHTERWLTGLTNGLKRQRVARFVEALALGPDSTVLDVGSEDGSYLARYYPWPERITLADIFEAPMRRGVERFGLRGYLLLPVDGPIPAGRGEFDAVWCNSAIEHVTVPRCELGHVSSAEFQARADAHQRRFAEELRRVGRQYFVQTPYVHFPVEAHSLTPGVQYLGHRVRHRLSRMLKRWWLKQWTADWCLYNLRRFKRHFPDATDFHFERVFGLAKSLIAIRRA